MSLAKRLRVLIERETFKAMHYWCKKSSPREVGGVALVSQSLDILLVHTATLLPQTVSHGEVDFQTEPVHRWLEKRFTSEAVNCAMPRLTWCFWHSHPTFSVGFSAVDDRWIENFVNEGLLVSICVNDKGDFAHRVDTLLFLDKQERIEDNGTHVTLPSDAWIHDGLAEERKATLDKEFDANVKERESKSTYGSGFYSSWGTPRDRNGAILLPASSQERAEPTKLPSGVTLEGEKRRLKALKNALREDPDEYDITFTQTGPIEVVVGKQNFRVSPTTAAKSILAQYTGLSMKQFDSWIGNGLKVSIKTDAPATVEKQVE